MSDERPRELMERAGRELIQSAREAEGPVLSTRIALWAVEASIRDLEQARLGLESRLALIDRAA